MADPIHRYNVVQALKKCGGMILPFHFTQEGAQAWYA